MVQMGCERARGSQELVFDHYVDVVGVEAGAEGGGGRGRRGWRGGGCAGGAHGKLFVFLCREARARFGV